MPDFFARPLLQTARTALLPLVEAHFADLAEAGRDPKIWRWMPRDDSGPGGAKRFVADALALRDAGQAVPFATVDRTTGRIVGSTRFLALVPAHRRLEIGATWLTPDAQRTHVNTEAKLLQLWWAFERLGARRVEWKTDSNNARSRAALLRLGATEEGTFHQHMLYPDGRNRDSVYFAVVDHDWPKTRRYLEAKLSYAFEPEAVLANDN